MPRNIAIIQARMSSTRLPGKVLMPLLDRPTILFMLERVRAACRLDDIVVATSNDASDDLLALTLQQAGANCFRGNLNDVLDRYHAAAEYARADNIVRLTGDCPLMDADLIDTALDLLASSGAHYVSNVDPPTYPDGLDVEAFTFEALHSAWQHACLPVEREHVTTYLRSCKERFRAQGFSGLSDLSALRWTVDHADDLAHVRMLVERVGARTPTDFDRFDLYRACEHGSAIVRQPAHRRNEGMQPHPIPGDLP